MGIIAEVSWAPERERTLRGPLNICHGCGQVNALEARFCRRCETPLPPEPEPRSESPTRPQAVEAPPAPVAPPRGSRLEDIVALVARGQLRWARRRRRRRDPVLGDPRRLAGVGLLVGAAAVLAVIAVLDTSGGSRAPGPRGSLRAASRVASATRAKRTPARLVPARRAPAKRAPAKASPAKPASTAVAPDPVSVVSGYWRSISRHAFATAYAKLAPGSIDLGPAQFAAYERQIGVSSVEFSGRPAWRSPTEAGVAVEELVTRDARFGCRSWSGEYVVRTAGGRWQIARAAIAPHPCTG